MVELLEIHVCSGIRGSCSFSGVIFLPIVVRSKGVHTLKDYRVVKYLEQLENCFDGVYNLNLQFI